MDGILPHHEPLSLLPCVDLRNHSRTQHGGVVPIQRACQLFHPPTQPLRLPETSSTLSYTHRLPLPSPPQATANVQPFTNSSASSPARSTYFSWRLRRILFLLASEKDRFILTRTFGFGRRRTGGGTASSSLNGQILCFELIHFGSRRLVHRKCVFEVLSRRLGLPHIFKSLIQLVLQLRNLLTLCFLLAGYGYSRPFTHATRPITFSLVVHDSSVKYVGREYTEMIRTTENRASTTRHGTFIKKKIDTGRY
jgi:hypothetical protein